MRVLLFTGKGGVGKTTASAATAALAASRGRKTLVLSTDPAHSLADAFDRPLSAVGTPITDRLWGQQLDAQERMEEGWHEIQAEDGSVRLNLAHVLWVRTESDEHRVGFGIASAG